jgi:hypothetical protein
MEFGSLLFVLLLQVVVLVSNVLVEGALLFALFSRVYLGNVFAFRVLVVDVATPFKLLLVQFDTELLNLD